MKHLCLALAVAGLLVACGEPEDGAVANNIKQGSSAGINEEFDGSFDLGSPDAFVGSVRDSVERGSAGSRALVDPVGENKEENVASDVGDGESAAVGDEDSFIGNYDGDMEISQEMIDAIKAVASVSGEDPDEMVAQMLRVKSSMELKKNGVCIMTSEADGTISTKNAKWSLNDEGTEITVKLDPDAANSSFMGAAVPDLVLVVSDGGKTLTYKVANLGAGAPKGTGMKLTYTRR